VPGYSMTVVVVGVGVDLAHPSQATCAGSCSTVLLQLLRWEKVSEICRGMSGSGICVGRQAPPEWEERGRLLWPLALSLCSIKAGGRCTPRPDVETPVDGAIGLTQGGALPALCLQMGKKGREGRSAGKCDIKMSTCRACILIGLRNHLGGRGFSLARQVF
jgi:hypothetical protein